MTTDSTAAEEPAGGSEPAADAATECDYSRQIAKYQRRMRLCFYFTGGLGGIALYGAGDVAAGVFNDRPFYRAVFFSLALGAGGLLGLAYGGFEWASTRLERLVEDGVVKKTDPYDRKKYPPPRVRDWIYRGGTVLTVAAGGWLLFAVWCAA
ncbi:hypothetical protein [Kribbella sp. NPDC049227]|uniref:hypothetical protein n=1 Tax=Kribbella sp. NPDC049227 TaxID=3364113 RepID=UPI003713E0A8